MMTTSQPRQANQRGAARLAAVQALYQMDVGRQSLEETLAQFNAFRLRGVELEGEQYLPADADFFGQIVRGVIKGQIDIDPVVDNALSGWPMARIDATLRAILRAGGWELLRRPDIPHGVVITEYVDIAKAFFADDEPKLVNGVLDAIARTARPQNG